MAKTFKPSEDGFYRIKESEKGDLNKFFKKQMEGNPKTPKGNLSKKGVNVKTIITTKKGREYEAVFKSDRGIWKFNDKDKLGASGTKRTKYLKLSNTLNTVEEQKAFKAKSDALPTGIEGDHIYEVQETGPMMEQLELDKKSGTITTKEYNRRKQILQDTGIGDNPKNFQELTGKQNTIKQAEVARKNKALELMEMKNPSSRALKLVKNSKALKVGKFAGKAIPYVGGAIALSSFGGSVHAMQKEGFSKKTGTDLAFRTVDLALEGVDALTGGLSTPVTLALQLALAGAENTINQGAAKISTSDRKKFR